MKFPVVFNFFSKLTKQSRLASSPPPPPLLLEFNWYSLCFAKIMLVLTAFCNRQYKTDFTVF